MNHPVNQAMEAVIFDAIANQPRSQQTLIGPSEIGTDCVRCLARKLAGVERNKPQGINDLPWLPFLGTSMHEMLEGFFRSANVDGETPRWLVETRLTVGAIGPNVIQGSCDLFDTSTGTVIDHKLVGTTKLASVTRKGPGDTYRIQAHLYGLGWKNAGYNVNEVAVKFYPRNNISLAAGIFWSEPFDEQVALDALARANEIYAKVTSTEDLNAYLRTLDTSKDCFSCSEYPSVDEPVEVYVDDLFTQPNSK